MALDTATDALSASSDDAVGHERHQALYAAPSPSTFAFLTPVSPKRPSDTFDLNNPLEARFMRDTAIRGLLNDLVRNLDPQEFAAFQREVERKQDRQPADEQLIATFSLELARIFSELAALGVQVVSLPFGRKQFFECTPVEWVDMYEHLLSQRQSLEQGTYAIDGATPLSVRPHPAWSFKSRDVRNATILEHFMTLTDLVGRGMPDDFSELSQIFTELDSLGVHLLTVPQGRKNFSECTPGEWRRLFVDLSLLREELSFRIDDLQQKLAPHGGPVRQQYDLADFVGAEVPDYRAADFSYRVQDGLLQGLQEQIGRLFGENSMIFRWTHHPETRLYPTPKDASEYIGAFVDNVLPGLRRAVAHHTSWQSARAYDLVSRNHRLGKARELIGDMYATHDAAVAILTELDTLMLGAREVVDERGARDVDFVLGEVRASLEKFHALK